MMKIVEAVDKYMAMANAHFYPRVLTTPTIIYTLRGTKAGYATYEPNIADFNMGIYHENVDKFLVSTVPHEVAHLLAFQLQGENGKGHGYWWKFVMEQVLKVPAKRCHSYSVEHHKTRKIRKDWIYQCSCRTHTLSTIKHNKILNNKAKYRCNVCQGRLIFIGEGAEMNKKAA